MDGVCICRSKDSDKHSKDGTSLNDRSRIKPIEGVGTHNPPLEREIKEPCNDSACVSDTHDSALGGMVPDRRKCYAGVRFAGVGG
jgi:hypothetical protein